MEAGIPKVEWWKDYKIWMGVSIVLLVSLLGVGYTFKHTKETLEKDKSEMKETLEGTLKELTASKQETYAMRQSLEKEKSKSKWKKRYNEAGVLIEDEGETSASSENRINELQTEKKEVEFQRDLALAENKALKTELELKSKEETIKRDPFNMDFGGDWDLSEARAEWSAGVSKTLLTILGIQVNLRAGISQ